MLIFALNTEPLAAEKLFSVGPLAVTNSMLFGFLAAILTLALLIFAARRSQLAPRSRLAYYTEVLVDAIWGVALDSFGDRRKALKHLPLLVTLFTFIFISNLSGLLPGVGSLQLSDSGHSAPLLRAFTTDLNGTLALAVLTIGLVQFYALSELGLRGHFRHYFTDKPWKPANLFIGLNEIFSDFLKVVTLSMRLFGVIYAGEVLINAVGQLAGNLAWFAMVPTILLEIFFSAVQAYVFMMLTTTYLAMATAHDGSQTASD